MGGMKPRIATLASCGLTLMCIGASADPIQIDAARSKIEVAVTCSVDSFVGQLERYDAAIEVDASNPLPSKAKLSFNFANLKTGKKDRDEAMLKWLEFGANPEGSFLFKNWKQTGLTNIASGELTLHGVTQSVEIPVTVKNQDGHFDLTGTASFDYRNFNLPKIRKALILTVSPKLQVRFHLEGTPAASK